MSAVITRETSDALDRVMTFFGINGYNRFLFGDAARHILNHQLLFGEAEIHGAHPRPESKPRL